MSRKYQKKVILTNGHTKGITAVSFSPRGTFLATAGLDGRVCIWLAEDGALLHEYAGQCPVLCLVWDPAGEEVLLYGTQTGSIEMLTVTIALVCCSRKVASPRLLIIPE